MQGGNTQNQRWMSRIWFAYTSIAAAVSLVVLTQYVNTYDDYDISPRLKDIGSVTLRTMNIASFPSGWIFGAILNAPIQRSFACDGITTHPCAVFIDWWIKFGAIILQSVMILLGFRSLKR